MIPTCSNELAPCYFNKRGDSPLPDRLVISADAFSCANAATKEALEPAVSKLARLVGKIERKQISVKPIEQWLRYQGVLQGEEAGQPSGEWIDQNNPRFGFEVADNFLRGTRTNSDLMAEARQFRAERRQEFFERFDKKTVICLPTTPFPAPLAGQPRSRSGICDSDNLANLYRRNVGSAAANDAGRGSRGNSGRFLDHGVAG